MKISLLVATDLNKGIGIENKLPWHLPSDMKYFREKTTGHHILMGRKTFDSIGKPLPNRTTLIITRSTELEIPGAHIFNDIQEAFLFAENSGETELFVVGGEEIYKLALPFADTLYLTEIEHRFDVDAWLDISLEQFKEISRTSVKADEKNKWNHHFVVYQRK